MDFCPSATTDPFLDVCLAVDDGWSVNAGATLSAAGPPLPDGLVSQYRENVNDSMMISILAPGASRQNDFFGVRVFAIPLPAAPPCPADQGLCKKRAHALQ
jgi:hypothetical protein